ATSHLPPPQPWPPPLPPRPAVRRHHHNRPVHLRRPRDHVLDVVGVPWTVDVRVVPLRRLVLHVRHRNRDPPLPLLRRVVDRPKLPHRHPAELRVQHLRDRRRPYRTRTSVPAGRGRGSPASRCAPPSRGCGRGGCSGRPPRPPCTPRASRPRRPSRVRGGQAWPCGTPP